MNTQHDIDHARRPVSIDAMRVEIFAEPGDIDPAALASAVFFDLVEGADPDQLIRFLTDQVELPPDEAQVLVGQENGRLQDRMHWVADELLENRERPAVIVTMLIEQDWPRALAESFVARTQADLTQLAQTTEGRDQLLAKSRRGMLFGFLWFAGGTLATWFTGYAAEQGNRNYQLLAWGPIIYGMVLFAHSAFRWCRYKVGGATSPSA